MVVTKFVLFSLLLIVPICNAARLNPITRVVGLLEDLAKQVEQAQKDEDKLYKTFACFCQNTEAEKAALIEKNSDTIKENETQISDIDNNLVDFTSERPRLQKELSDITQDIEDIQAQRKLARETWTATKEELKQAITALNAALGFMVKGGGKKASLLSINIDQASAKFELGLDVDVSALLDMGSKVLSANESKQLSRYLMSQPVSEGKYDQEHLSRKSGLRKRKDGEAGYNFQSGDIHSILKKLQENFTAKQKTGQADFGAADTAFSQDLEDKRGRKTDLESSLSELKAENAARDAKTSELQQENDELQSEIDSAENYSAELAKQCAQKKAEYTDRKGLRTKEVQSIHEAVKILRSDSARSTFDSSFESQGYSFVQFSFSRERAVARARAAKILEQYQHKTKSAGLGLLAYSLKAGGSTFQDVIDKVEEMVEILHKDQKRDSERKEECEKDHFEFLEATKDASTKADEFDAERGRQAQTGAKLEQEIADGEALIEKLEAEKDETLSERQKRSSEYSAARQQDEEARGLVKQAIEKLKSFYKDNLSLIQEKQPVQAKEGSAQELEGQVMKDAPGTWDESNYGGASSEHEGIVSIMSMIADDISKDIETAEKEDNDDRNATKKNVKSLEEQIVKVQNTNSDRQIKRSEASGAETQASDDRKSQLETYENETEEWNNHAKSCDFIVTKYGTRRTNRQMEIDGLHKASSILKKFTSDYKKNNNRKS